MIPVLLSNKVIKELEGWLSSFIWSKRRPRLKLSKLQMTGSDGGLDVPNLRLHQLATHPHVITNCFKNDPTSIWINIENSQSKCSYGTCYLLQTPNLLKNYVQIPLLYVQLKLIALFVS